MVLGPILALAVVAGVLSVPVRASAAPRVSAPRVRVTADASKVQMAAEAASARVLDRAAVAVGQAGGATAPLAGADGRAEVAAKAAPQVGSAADRAVHAALAKAAAAARKSHAPVTVDSQTTPISQTVADPDGSFRTTVSTKPVRYQDAAGGWHSLDLSLQGGGTRHGPVAAGPWAGRLAARSDAADGLVQLGPSGSRIGWSAAGIGQVPLGVGKGANAPVGSYPGALPGGWEIDERVTAFGAEESVVIPTRAAAAVSGDERGAYRDVFSLPDGVTARQLPAGANGISPGVEFVGATGSVLATFGGGLATDSAGSLGGASRSGDPAVEAPASPVLTRLVGQAGSRATIEVSVPSGWLGDAARVFPVTVDPWMTAGTSYSGGTGAGADAYVDAAFPTTTEGTYDPGILKFGRRSVNGGTYDSRSYLWFDLSSSALNESENHVLSASLSLNNTYSYSCLARQVDVAAAAGSWWPTTLTWNNQPNAVAPVVAKSFAHGYSTSCPAARESFDVTQIAQRWSNGPTGYNGGIPDYGFQAWADNSTDLYAYKRIGAAENGSGNASTLSISWENCTLYAGNGVCGAIRNEYGAQGGPRTGGVLGLPTTAEIPLTAGSGQIFQNGKIYWSAATGAHSVRSPILDAWNNEGIEVGWLGYPASDDYALTNGDTRQDFSGGYIEYNPKTKEATPAATGTTLVQPVANQRSGRRIPIQMSAPTALGAAQLQYRRGAADSWKPINLATVTDKNGSQVCASNCSGASVSTTTVNNQLAFATSGNVVYWDAGLQLQGVGGVLDVRVTFQNPAGQRLPTSPAPGVTYDPNSGQSGTAGVGPASVNLLTGEASVSATDASAFGVSISRSYGSRSTDAGTANGAAAFGPQWKMGGVAETASTDYTQVKKTSGTSLDVISADGSTLSFTRSADNSSWVPEPGAESVTLSGPPTTPVPTGPSSYTLTDSGSGVITTFTHDTTVANTPADAWPVSDVNPVGTATAKGKTRYLYQSDSTGKLQLARIAAPNPALPDVTAAACVAAATPLGSLPAGCRVLAAVWTTTSPIRVTRIDLYATDPATPTAGPTATTLASYGYDTNGYLTSVTDPRPGQAGGTGGSYPAQTALATSYSYQPDTTYPNARTLDPTTGAVTTTSMTKPGRLATLTTSGRQPWTLQYSAAAGPAFEAGQAGSDGRIIGVTRPTLTPGSPSLTNGAATTTIVYGVPLTTAAGGAQDLGYAQTRWWGQDIPPTDGTAIFPANAPPGANTGDHWAGDDTGLARDWSTATVDYLDVNGRTVNTATPTTGTTPAIDVTNYDLAGNPTFSLTAGNRATVMGQDDPATGSAATALWSSLGLPTTTFPRDLVAPQDNDPAVLDTRTRASQLATLNTYEYGPVSSSERATSVQGPLHAVLVGSGPTGAGSTTPSRTVTTTTYDQNRPAGAAATAVDLPTTTVQGTLPGEGTTYSPAALVDTRTTTTGYDWNLGQPTTTATDPGGLAITRTTSYDSLGRVISTVMPQDAGTPGAATAVGTTMTAYYDPAAAGACGGPAATVWGGMVCSTGPAGPITGATTGSATTLPTTVTQYGRTGVVTTATETSGAMVRTTTTCYDAADRPRQVTVTGSDAGCTTTPAGTSMTRTTAYNDAGDTISVTDPAGGSITSTTDMLGRTISSNDASGLTSTTGYDDLNRPTSTTQSGTIAGNAHTYTTVHIYDATTGQVTSGHDEHAGDFTASYGLDGGLVGQTWTGAAGGALGETTLTDTAGTPVSKTWTQGTGSSQIQLLTDLATPDGHDQTVTDKQKLPTLAPTIAGQARDRRYGYDTAGRLTSTADTRQTPGAGAATQQCTIRAWAFGSNSNRTGEATTTPTAGACPATGYTVPATTGTGATTHTYNTADQLTDTVGGIPTSYDPFGRTTATNGTTAGTPGTAKATTLGYTVTDMAAAQTLYTGTDTTTPVESSQTWTLDPTGTRFASSIITTGSGPTATTVTKTYRYVGSGDSPALIDEGDSSASRPITGIGGQMIATAIIFASAPPKVTWQLTNLHGDIAASLDNTTGAAPTPVAAVDEYGTILDTPVSTPAAGTTPGRYDWLGAHQRSAENIAGLTLMGVRLYRPSAGRFMSVDPIQGGCANNYVYTFGNPNNTADLLGKATCVGHTFSEPGHWADFKLYRDKGKWNWRASLVGAGRALAAPNFEAVRIRGGIFYGDGRSKASSGIRNRWWDNWWTAHGALQRDPVAGTRIHMFAIIDFYWETYVGGGVQFNHTIIWARSSCIA